MKEEIIQILEDYSTTMYSKGSCGELGDSIQGIEWESFEDIALKIINLINNKNLIK